ncbi:hypothetical protein KORDIASMS9_00419 [Kordia sp. SMS9]|nr:hypothetical protein KORDIASMS9_00419 [Kordia sp. SMS9]
MYADQIKQPIASAILDRRNVTIHNFSNKETVVILKFLSIPSFCNVLISKYEDIVEFSITIKKIDCVDEKLVSLHSICGIVTNLTGVNASQISNTFTNFDTYDLLIIKCKLNAINQ